MFGPLSDRYGRRRLILPGMLLQALGLVALATLPTFAGLLAATVVLGLGTGMVYPTLIALVAIVATLGLGGISVVIAGVSVALTLATFAVRKEV